MANQIDQADIAIIGAGNVGIAVAYYLSRKHGFKNVVLVDSRDPMSLTSAQSGENYRNWWPHPIMTQFTNDGIRLLEEIATETDNRINMTRRGYALVTRNYKPDNLIEDLYRGYGTEAEGLIRFHEGAGDHPSYRPATTADWRDAPDGVDVLCDKSHIQHLFPAYEPDIATVLHVRRGGSISGQQLGQFMLEFIKENGGRLVRGEVTGIERGSQFDLAIKTESGVSTLKADRIVNAAGPFIEDISKLLGEELNVSCIYQQKIAFEDHLGIVPRNLPFTIDLDGQKIAWTDEEREILAEDPATAHLIGDMPGAIHCRPDGAENGKWIKLGWAINHAHSDPHGAEPIDQHFPDILLRAASRLQPGLSNYVGHLPRNSHHYGGYYTTTRENWPLIGPMLNTPGAFIAGALSGFGTMASCISGLICADQVAGAPTVEYASKLSPSRYQDKEIMTELEALNNGGHL
ncbi:NAD(P)/FAD-dependent oxidoreductase [Ochrobactrum chromiisoli]|uniref:FAD-binding oxidoreductase n=1 Tax=Ochrobactrum chromiisoli TaxID=2993941 RepID=A0ABT3QSI5_9HYPH|nr:FAD-binding oxidoreductase [Ochrobactrum chromiisoli]MCX2698586.1 FAD-binding oxidoreductase [Ochrobactrum chromiisoli]